MKIVKEKLYEDVGQYSTDQLRQDFEDYITLENVNIGEEEKQSFFHDVLLISYNNGMINSTNELYDFISIKINSFSR